jgi:hypothetical protein
MRVPNPYSYEPTVDLRGGHHALTVSADGITRVALQLPDWHFVPIRLVPDSGRFRKQPLVKWGSESGSVPGWDLERLRSTWASAGGSASVGVDCFRSGLVVFDVDRDPGPEWRKMLEVPDTLALRSCTKGMPHFVMAQPSDVKVAEGRFPGGEVKASGLVVLSRLTPLNNGPIREVPDEILGHVTTVHPEVWGHPRPGAGRPGSPSSFDLDTWLDETPSDDQRLMCETADRKFIQQVIDRFTSSDQPRYLAMIAASHTAAIEAAAGLYAARAAFDELEDAYSEARDLDPDPAKRYTHHRQAEYRRAWAGTAAMIEAGGIDLDARREDLVERLDIYPVEDLRDWFDFLDGLHGGHDA